MRCLLAYFLMLTMPHCLISFFFFLVVYFFDYGYLAKLNMRLGINWSVLSVFLLVYTGRHVADCVHK